MVEATRTEMLGLVDTRKALAGFDTLQIVHYLPRDPPLSYGGCCPRVHVVSAERRNEEAKGEVNGLKDLVVDCFRKPKTGFQEGGGRKNTTLWVIELRMAYGESHLDSLTVEECEV